MDPHVTLAAGDPPEGICIRGFIMGSARVPLTVLLRKNEDFKSSHVDIKPRCDGGGGGTHDWMC